VALPEVCLLSGVALRLGRELTRGLVVDAAAMRANLDRVGDQWASERLLAGLAPRLGKHAAQQLLHELLAPGATRVQQVVEAVAATGGATEAECRTWLSGPVAGASAAMVDQVVQRAHACRAVEPETWP
jgi:adenylosuccinate lyase